MNNRSLPGPNETAGLSDAELRRDFLVEDLFATGEARLLHTGTDRLAVGGVMPPAEIRLEGDRQLGTSHFSERLEPGTVNAGNTGVVSAGGEGHEMRRLDCLYVGMGEEQVWFRSCKHLGPAETGHRERRPLHVLRLRGHIIALLEGETHCIE